MTEGSFDSACPPEDDLLAFSSGDVSAVKRATLIGHLAACDECRMVTSELSKERLGHAATATPGNVLLEQLPPIERGRGASGLSFRAGETIAGKFEVVKILGEGGMGVVVEAEHLLLEQRVALKFMGRALVSDPEATRRFLREARAAARIPSEHVVKILDVATLDDGVPYIVMERLEGADLSAVLAREGRLEPARAVGYVLQAMEALAHAHGKGIVHRDLKPANLFLAKRADGSEIVKVLDFGIAKAQEHVGASGVTTSRTILGSPRYMAPEQMQSAKDADSRADVWALGTILFELVSGRPAFEGETLAALSVAICAGPKPRLSAAFPGVPPDLDAAVGDCLERNLEARTRDVGSLARALASVGGPASFGSVERIVSILPAGGGLLVEPGSRGGSVPHVSVRDPEPRPPTAGKGLAIGVLAFGLVVLVGGVYVGLDHGKAAPGAVVEAPAVAMSAPSVVSAPQPPPSSSTAEAPSAPPKALIGIPVALPEPRAASKSRPAAPSATAPHLPSPPPLPSATATPYDERK